MIRATIAFVVCCVSLAWLLDSLPAEYAFAVAQGLAAAWLVWALVFSLLVMTAEEGAVRPGRRKR